MFLFLHQSSNLVHGFWLYAPNVGIIGLFLLSTVCGPYSMDGIFDSIKGLRITFLFMIDRHEWLLFFLNTLLLVKSCLFTVWWMFLYNFLFPILFGCWMILPFDNSYWCDTASRGSSSLSLVYCKDCKALCSDRRIDSVLDCCRSHRTW